MNENILSGAVQRTLPYSQYTSPQVFAEEREKIFSKDWQLVGHTSQVEKPGDFITCDVAGQPIIITRGTDDVLRAFYNICPHRGTKVERNAKGNKKILQCTYHGWTFNLDGKVNKAPNFKQSDLGEYDCLATIKLETHKSMVFVNLDKDAPPFAEEYQMFLENIDVYPFLDSLKLQSVNTRVVKANWKAIIDNYLECDHCSIAHKDFAKVFDLSKYDIIPCDKFSYQCSNVRDNTDQQLNEKPGARFYWVWPNMMISIYPGSGNMTTSQIIPIDSESSLAIYKYYFKDPTSITKEDEELIKFVDRVREEDFELVELLQEGFDNKAFKNGIYSPSEQGLKHFHQLIEIAMK
ncbi:aromatic ring-hydroxylating oxygenase subunit alpha [Bacillus sp. FJAT-45350]|uniref:aromatic ring-hydroxylating oxygenase subunit alpha n=1 Tax=Bacillus sp. FJAT-45350 TaxID=2011014 RepID=UPI000BB7F3CF|nr:aromatic ring-hydroxylating dioxygenase subunit alpha [Bacillus sp. FJAT-45350]